MKAIILVGGYGTRLRPLTLSVPKPLIHFCNRPMIEYQIRALVQVGVKHVILAVAYQPDAMREALRDLEEKYKIKISCSVEEEPLMTAGPIRLASSLLFEDENDEDHPNLFFCFNSDIICEFPLKEILQQHLELRKQGTICVTTVEDPSAFGVVLYDSTTMEIDKFVEKPSQWVGDSINAGLYLFDRSIVDRIELRPTSIEREIFPAMAADHQLCCYRLEGYWADIGKPKDFLEGTQLYLEALRRKVEADKLTDSPLSRGAGILGNVLVHPSAKIGTDCVIGPDVTVGPNCVVGNGVRLRQSALMANVVVKDFTLIDNAIIGWNSRLGNWVRIEGLTVLGQDVSVKSECFINGAFVLPYKAINASVPTAGSIIM